MKRYPYTTFLQLAGVLFLTVLCVKPGHAQDIHYTQFHNAPFALSPGLTGVFKEDARVMANYRKQWASVRKVNFETYSVAADMKLWPYRPNNTGFFSVGLSANRDQAGISKLTLLNIGLNTSYTQRLSNHTFLSFGLQGAFNQRNFDISALAFDRQYDEARGVYDPRMDNGETNFNQTRGFFSLGAGFNLRLQALNEQDLVDDLRHRSKLDLGFGINNLNRPDQSFETDVENRAAMRISPYALSVIQLGKGNSKLDLAINAVGQFQRQSFEGLGMVGLRYHLAQQVDNRQAIQLSGAVRFSDGEDYNIDAVAPVLDIFVNNWQFGMSYDFNVSVIRAATNGRGGPEFFARYNITKVKLPHPRLCQIL